ncbi:MAG: threonylcarbamoyl-AMP synthase [Firmicutes bacterium]|nr:threonylcarbamoyl-AMP synthase [Bacillota bacterium]
MIDTLLLSTEDADLKKAAEIIRNGGLAAFPTETVYGLGADAFSPDSAKKAYAAKGRPSDNPLIVHIAKAEDIGRVARTVPEEALKLAEAFWPGPLTMVLPKRPELPKETTGGLDTIAVRMPDSEATLKFIEYSGTAVSGPSANISGRPSPTAWQHVQADLAGKIDAIICGEPCKGGIESTVLDLTDPKAPVILRPGLITPEMIAAVLKTEVCYDPALFTKPSDDPDYRPKAPGQKYKHYSPKAEVVVFEGDPECVCRAMDARLQKETAAGRKAGTINVPGPKEFFAQLRQFDAEGADIILIAAPDSGVPAEKDAYKVSSGVPAEKDAYKVSSADQAGPDGKTLDPSVYFSLMNRMLKAAGYNIVKAGRHNMKIALAADHGGFALKQELIEHLKGRGFEVEDLGIYTPDPVDYPEYGRKCAEYVISGKADLGIVCCGTGLGIGMAANKVKGIRCAELVTPFMAEMAKKHNHANMVSLGGRVLTVEEAKNLVDIWLDTEEDHGRHDRRVAQLNEM